MNPTPDALSPQLSDRLQRITDQGLSTRARYGHVALLLAATGMCVLIASLLATEPALVLRTKLSFVVMLTIALCWISYAIWTLANRRALLARHRVIAARMAVVFSAVFSMGALAIGLSTESSAGFLAAATGGAMLGAAVLLLRHAHHAVARMQLRRAQLEARLGGVQH